MEDDETWRYVQGLQLFVLLVFLVYLLTCIRYDSPKFYVTQKQDEKAKKVIGVIYKKDALETETSD